MRNVIPVHILMASLLLLFTFSACNIGSIIDDTVDPIITEPEILECNSFSDDLILVNNPDLPVDYIVSCRANVSGDLTIEPGVVIHFEDGAGLFIHGSINAVGTEDQPIVLRGVQEVAGYWAGIYISSTSVLNRLEYCIIDHAGGHAFSSNDQKGAIIMGGGPPRMAINNCSIGFSSTYGVNLVLTTTELTSFENNTIHNCETPIYADAEVVQQLGGSTSFIDNTNSFIEVGAGVVGEGSTVWAKNSIPYHVSATDFGLTKSIFINGTNNLILEPGVAIELNSGGSIEITGEGALTAVGTSDEPILFTGTTKLAGAWKGVYFSGTKNILNRIEHARFEYAGSEYDAAIYMRVDPRLTVRDSEFEFIDGCGIYNDNSFCFCNPNFEEENNNYINIEENCFD